MAKVKVKVKVFTAVLAVMAGTAMADVRIFQDSEAVESALRHNGWMKDEGTPSRLLARVACQGETGKKVEGDCEERFLKRNGIEAAVVAPEEFRTKAKGEGWWIPTGTAPGAGEQAEKDLAHMQQRVSEMEKKSQASEKALRAEMSALKRQTKAAQAGAVKSEGTIAELGTRLESLEGSVWREVSELTSNAEETNRRLSGAVGETAALSSVVAALTTSDRQANNLLWTAMLSISGLIGGCLLLVGYLQHRRLSGLKEEIGSVKTIVGDPIEGEGLVGITNTLTDSAISANVRLMEAEKQRQQFRMELQMLSDEQCRLGGEVDQLRQEADDVLALSDGEGVKFDLTNPSTDTLEQLQLGRQHAVKWTGRYENGHFTVEIWREETTPAGQVETNVIRSVATGQRSGPMSLKRLRQRLVAAVIDGRVPTVKLLSSVA